ncbi:MAG TPA: tyrosine-type recombinase/integrase [Gemmatales bacterium]|nr:tyrosine-type recombinase/integrase [Gemmatales bacterium]
MRFLVPLLNMIDRALVPLNKQSPEAIKKAVPSLFLEAGDKAWHRYLEFFTAHIRNRNTRLSYHRAVWQFARFCERRQIDLHNIDPFIVAAYIEHKGKTLSKPTVKQHLAALRMLFDYLVVGQAIVSNPAASVRGPKHVVRRGKTPVLTAEDARLLLDTIDTNTIIGLRDRAIIGVMIYSFARVGAAVSLKIEDYYQQGKRFWLRLHEKGGKEHSLPVHHKAEEYLDAYLAMTGIGHAKDTPLFRRVDRKRLLQKAGLDRREVLAMIKRRVAQAGLPDSISCHSFRATGITTYLKNGGTLEKAQQIANHESPRTTKLYDRTTDEISLDEIERIII